MKPEKQQLLHEVLDADHDARRTATLLAGTRLLRRRRQWRFASQGLSLALVLLAAGICLKFTRSPVPSNSASVPPRDSEARAGISILTDDQLLALFPNTPVALATLPDGKKRLIFPHPGDEQKYVVHL